MDERTEAQKLADTAANSERRVIGGPVTDKVLVIAPRYDEARRWAHEHGITQNRTVFVGPDNFMHAMQGIHGAQHVILHWAQFTEGQREQIKDMLKVIESVPFEGDDDAVAGPAVDVRD